MRRLRSCARKCEPFVLSHRHSHRAPSADSSSDLRSAGQLLEMSTSLPLPFRSDFSVDLYLQAGSTWRKTREPFQSFEDLYQGMTLYQRGNFSTSLYCQGWF